MRQRLARIITYLILLALAPSARAQPLPGAGSITPTGAAGTHAWACVPLRSDSQSVAILHLPPRGPGVPDGTVRVALQLPDQPEALAAWQNCLYIALRPELLSSPHRRILTLTVEPGALEGGWVISGEGRLPTLPSLPGDGELRGFAVTPLGPAALLTQGQGEGLRLLLLSGPDWGRVSLPVEVRSNTGLTLTGTQDGLAVVDLALGRAWVATLRDDRAGLRVDWTSRGLAPAPDSARQGAARAIALLPQGLLYYTGTPAGGIDLWNATESTCYRLASVPAAGHEFAVAPLVSSGRLAVVWSEETASPPGDHPPLLGPGRTAADTRRTHILELSTYTGETLYDGAARFDGPVSSQELKLLAAVLVVIMAVIVLFVLRPGGNQNPISLPKDIVLADPGRRIAAGLIDLVIAVVIAGRFTEFSLADLFAPARLMTDAAPVTGLIAIAAVGFLHCTLGEWLWGRSLGKAVVGCAVAWPGTIQYEGKIEPIVRRPTFWRAATRNLIKWVIPPVALSGVFAPDGRHRGDVLAGTAVVEHAGDEDESEPPPDDGPPQ